MNGAGRLRAGEGKKKRRSDSSEVRVLVLLAAVLAAAAVAVEGQWPEVVRVVLLRVGEVLGPRALKLSRREPSREGDKCV